jgi:hypothetical protein
MGKVRGILEQVMESQPEPVKMRLLELESAKEPEAGSDQLAGPCDGEEAAGSASLDAALLLRQIAP